MARVKPNGQIWGLEFNLNVCFSFCGNQTISGGDIANSVFHLENSRSRSQQKLTKIWACFLSLAWSKLRLCSANHRAGYFSNLACDWLSIVWAYSKQETEKWALIRPSIPALVQIMVWHWPGDRSEPSFLSKMKEIGKVVRKLSPETVASETVALALAYKQVQTHKITLQYGGELVILWDTMNW